jgi:hypothetical protein
MRCIAKYTRGDKTYGVYEGDDDFGDTRVARGNSMGMKGANVGCKGVLGK